MADKDVITALELCANISQDGCMMLCPYKDDQDETYPGLCEHIMKQDALELLERQQAEIDRLKDQQPKWIPVSEELPKKPDGYPKCELRRMYFLVSLESGCVESLGFDFDDNRWHTTGSPVVAWMKLPEPYTEGR